MSRLIFHVDVNSAYLSWEAARRVSLGEDDIRLIPSAIGGDRDKRTGVILAKSIPAKKFGIKTGEPVAIALRKCPDLFLARPDFRLYEASSRAFMDICREYAPVVEKYSIDECFLDFTEQLGGYEETAASIKKVMEIIEGIIECSKYTCTADRGFDLYVSEDGVSFNTITTNGFGDPYNHGLRVFANMDSGLMIGTANPFYSTQIWMLEEDPSITETATPATSFFTLFVEKIVRFIFSFIEMIKENLSMIFPVK